MSIVDFEFLMTIIRTLTEDTVADLDGAEVFMNLRDETVNKHRSLLTCLPRREYTPILLHPGHERNGMVIQSFFYVK